MLKIKHINTDIYLKSILNVLTEAHDYVKLTEAVPYSVAKEYMNIERSPEAEARIKEVFNKLKSLPNARQLDKRGYRIAFPYSEDSTEFEIQSILEPYDFSIKDYKDGVALNTKSNTEIAIGKALNIVSKKEPDAKELIDRYAAIKGKGATSKDEDLMMVFSSAKYDITGMSTGRDLPEFGDWDSCMNVIHGSNRRYVKLDIQEGSIICYLTTVSDTNLQRALGRVLIKPYLNTEDKKDVVLYTEFKTYGKIPNSEKFIDIVDDYMEKTQKLSGSYKRLGCLYSDSDRFEIEGKETIRTRALKKLEDEKELTDAEFLSLPLKNKRKLIDTYIDNAYILNATRFSFTSESQKKKYIRLLLKFDKSDSIEEPLFLKLSKELKNEIIDYKLKKIGILEDYEFKEATPKQKEKYIDEKLLDNDFDFENYSDLYDYEFEAATPEQIEKYIDYKIKYNMYIEYYELQAATKKQKEKYIDIIIHNKQNIGGYELELATTEQKEKYFNVLIEREARVVEGHIKYMSQNMKEKYIEYLIDSDKILKDYELSIATPEQKERYQEYAKD